MNGEELNELYHNLRLLCVTSDLFQKDAVAGIVSHLTQPQGDYIGLLRFLSYYGGRYILSDAVKLLRSSGLEFSRIVELGAGFGWLGRGISNAYNQTLTIFVDKRHWVLTDIIADIETQNGVRRVVDELRDGDLIVMSELLHCLDEPEKTLRPFRKWPMLVVEYSPMRADYLSSYIEQIREFGCKPVGNVESVFPGSKIVSVTADPYMIWLVFPP